MLGAKVPLRGLQARPPMQTASRGLAYRPLHPLQGLAAGGLSGLGRMLMALGAGQPQQAAAAFSSGLEDFDATQRQNAADAQNQQMFDLQLEGLEADKAERQESKDAAAKQKVDFDAAVDRLVVAGSIDASEADAMKAGVGKLSDFAEKPKEEKQPFTGAIKDESGNWVYDPDYLSGQEQLRRAGASTTNVTVGGESKADAAQRKSLNEEEGKRWSKLQSAGNVAASTMGEFEVLDALIGEVPSGPWVGRLAESFPEFSDPAAAFQSVVVRVAPTLRVEGSGATSDIEYEGMLKSLPRLRNQPGANRVISATMKAKAAINIERAEVVTAYQNEEITAADARKRLAEIDKRSIMTPELKAALGTVTGSGGSDDAAVVKELPGEGWE